jgi:predicted AlkP superfamily phosphohydrolase/phosphomutase
MQQGGKLKKMILIGVDGADWRLIEPWIEDGYLENFSESVKSGAKETLMSTIPPFTLPAWTSIFTGVNPGKHGITDNLIRIGKELIPASSHYRRVPLLWKVLGRHGLKSIVLNDPATYPPEPINGVMVTGFLTPPNSNSYTFPPEMKDEVDKASGGYMPEYDKFIAKNKEKAYNYIKLFAQKTASLALHMIKNHEWDIFNVTFTSTDRLQHFYWQDKHLLREHYNWLDSIIGELLNIASHEEANIIIVSDHGFTPIYKSVYINTMLAEEGFIRVKEGKLYTFMNRIGLNKENLIDFLQFLKIHNVISNFFPENLKQILPLPSKSSKTVSSQPIAKLQTGAGIFIEQTLCKNYEVIRNFIINKLLSLTDNDKKVIARVYKREHILWGPFIHRAPDLIVIPNEGYYLSTEIKDKIFGRPIQSTSNILRTGDHRIQGIFIAHGPDITRGVQLKEPLFTWDVAPLILHMLGLPIPSYMDGCVRKEIFREGSEPAVNFVKYEYGIGRKWVKSRLKKLRKKVV